MTCWKKKPRGRECTWLWLVDECPENQPSSINTAGEDRMLTGPEAGITRDTIPLIGWDDNPIRLFDTAGMRAKAKVQEKLERLSVSDVCEPSIFAQIVVGHCWMQQYAFENRICRLQH